MTKPNISRIERLGRKLINSAPIDDDEGFMTLAEFIDLYQYVVTQTKSVQEAHIILLGRSAVIQFPGLAYGRIVVRHLSRLTPAEFSRSVPGAIILGDKLSYSLGGQLKEELSNLPVLLAVFVLSFLAMFSIGYLPATTYFDFLADPAKHTVVAQAIEAFKTVGELLVTSATLFLSVFLIFTVAQNLDMVRDPFLFREGLAHKYHRDDVFVARVAIFCLLAGVVSVVMVVVPSPLQIVVVLANGVTVTINKFSLYIPLAISLSATGLALAFLSILYYFQRAIANAGTVMADLSLNQLRDSSLAGTAISDKVRKPKNQN